jgi:hypothetical protein
MSPGALYTLVSGGVTLAIEIFLFTKLYKSLRTGVVTVDVNFILNLLFFHSDSASSSAGVIAIERDYAPRSYWITISLLTIAAIIVGALAFLIARVGVT